MLHWCFTFAAPSPRGPAVAPPTAHLRTPPHAPQAPTLVEQTQLLPDAASLDAAGAGPSSRAAPPTPCTPRPRQPDAAAPAPPPASPCHPPPVVSIPRLSPAQKAALGQQMNPPRGPAQVMSPQLARMADSMGKCLGVDSLMAIAPIMTSFSARRSSPRPRPQPRLRPVHPGQALDLRHRAAGLGCVLPTQAS